MPLRAYWVSGGLSSRFRRISGEPIGGVRFFLRHLWHCQTRIPSLSAISPFSIRGELDFSDLMTPFICGTSD